jgi:hypothetical protein
MGKLIPSRQDIDNAMLEMLVCVHVFIRYFGAFDSYSPLRLSVLFFISPFHHKANPLYIPNNISRRHVCIHVSIHHSHRGRSIYRRPAGYDFCVKNSEAVATRLQLRPSRLGKVHHIRMICLVLGPGKLNYG